MPFGVELPDNLGAPEAAAPTGAPAATPEGSPAGASPGGATSSNGGGTPGTTQDLLDLDKHDRFRFAGRDWDRKGLNDAILMREDYTKKTTELAEARKFADNFALDLQAVARDPKRMEEFKRIYPREYVELAEKYLGRQTPQPQGNTPTTQPGDPRVDELYDKFSKWEKASEENQIKQIQSWLDNTFSALEKKYPLAAKSAGKEVVNARAEVAARQGTKITEEVLDKLFKAYDEETKTRWEEHYKTKVNEQLDAGRKARDMGPGGGTPTQPPKRAKTIREATKLAIEDLEARAS